jgi:hypothetical protein
VIETLNDGRLLAYSADRGEKALDATVSTPAITQH